MEQAAQETTRWKPPRARQRSSPRLSVLTPTAPAFAAVPGNSTLEERGLDWGWSTAKVSRGAQGALGGQNRGGQILFPYPAEPPGHTSAWKVSATLWKIQSPPSEAFESVFKK